VKAYQTSNTSIMRFSDDVKENYAMKGMSDNKVMEEILK
jgi:hypothetical protein